MSETVTRTAPRRRGSDSGRGTSVRPPARSAARSRAARERASAGASRPGASRAPREQKASPVEALRERGAGVASLVGRFRVPVIVVAALVVVLAALYAPAQGLYRAWRDQGAQQATLDELNQSIEEYQGDIDRLQTREGIEDEARKRGYVAEGETGVTVEGLPQEDSSQDDPAPATPWYLVLGDLVFQYDAE